METTGEAKSQIENTEEISMHKQNLILFDLDSRTEIAGLHPNAHLNSSILLSCCNSW
jgi:hypothetical protein